MKPDDKVYLAYFESQKTRLYFNEIKELTGLSDSSLARCLKKLVLKQFLNVEKTKSNTFYELQNLRVAALQFSRFAIGLFDNLNRGVKYPLVDFLHKIDDEIISVVLFGSASHKKERDGSDIDILIVSCKEIDLDLLKREVDGTSNYPLNIFYCSPADFRENTDHVIFQARKNGFPIKGEQFFYEVQLNV